MNSKTVILHDKLLNQITNQVITKKFPILSKTFNMTPATKKSPGNLHKE